MVAPNTNSKTAQEDKDFWATPTEIYRGALAYFVQKGLLDPQSAYVGDVCASKHNAKHERYFTEEQDALIQDWIEFATDARCNGVLWCNPPYSRGQKKKFIAKGIHFAENTKFDGAGVIMLLPADTSAAWFSECVKHAKAIAFICNGRISFINNSTGERSDGNNSGSVLVLFAKRDDNQKVARTMYVTRSKLEELGKE
jgi:phage N-6-adenine-methyltransferase